MSLDRLEAVLRRFHVGVELFHTGPLCGSESFDARPGRGFLHLLRSGAMQVRHAVPGHPPVQRLDTPTLLFYPGGHAHRFLQVDDGAAPMLTCAALDFGGNVQHPLVAGLPPLVALPLHEVAGLQASLALLFDEADQVRCGHRVLADRLLEVVLIQLLRWLFEHPGRAGTSPGLVHALSDPRLARALVAIHARPGHAWSLDALAAEAGMSRASFTSAFRRHVGRSAGDYLADYRMIAARRELSLGRPVARVADELGYASAAAFARMFKSRVGQTPKQWALQA